MCGIIDDSEFYRGLADAGGDGSALVFASNAQLELLHAVCDADILRRYLQSGADRLLTIIHCIRTIRRLRLPGVLRCDVAQNQLTVY